MSQLTHRRTGHGELAALRPVAAAGHRLDDAVGARGPAALPVSSRPARVLRLRYDQLVPWRPLVFDRYRVVEEHDRSVWQFERNPALERRQFIEFERLMRKLEYRFTDAAVDTSAGTPWLGWWTRQFDGSR